jgi:hypothetical protein
MWHIYIFVSSKHAVKYVPTCLIKRVFFSDKGFDEFPVITQSKDMIQP